MGEHALLDACEEHHRELEALGGVQGHEEHLALVLDHAVPRAFAGVGQLVGVGHQAHLFEVLVDRVELGGDPDELGQVL